VINRQLISLSQLSRRLDLPYSRLHRLVLAERLSPDIVAAGVLLFDARRLRSIAKKINTEIHRGLPEATLPISRNGGRAKGIAAAPKESAG
jgi:hypothetical protein